MILEIRELSKQTYNVMAFLLGISVVNLEMGSNFLASVEYWLWQGRVLYVHVQVLFPATANHKSQS